MTIEKINSVQTSTPQLQTSFKRENIQTAPAQKGKTKDVITTLSVLAAIGAASIALYEHRNTKEAVEKAVKKAEEEAKKKIEEAEQKAKQTVEDVDRKIKEAVDNAKKEFETEKEPKNTEPKILQGKPVETEIKPDDTFVVNKEAEEVKQKAKQVAINTAEDALSIEYRGLNEVERLIIERDALAAQKYGKKQSEARLVEVKERLEELGAKENPVEYTPEITTRIEIAKANIEKEHWQSVVEQYIEYKNDVIKAMEAKEIKPLELSEEEEKLQYEYASSLQEAQRQLDKHDMEWHQRFSDRAQKALQKLKEKNKEPLNFESADMQLQYKLLGINNSIRNYQGYADKMAEKTEKLIENLKEILGN